MTWFFLALGSVGALALAELTQQHLLTKATAYSPRTSSVLTFFVQWLLSVPVVLIFFTPQQLVG